MKKLLKNVVFVAATLAAGSAAAAVTFYEGEQFTGRPLSLNGAAPDFRAFGFNDRAMSMVVQGSPVQVCVDIHFQGQCQVFHPGSYPSLIGSGWMLSISSVRPAGYDPNGQFPAGEEPRIYQQPTWDQRGHDQRGHDQRGYDQRGHDQRGYDQRGYDQRGYDQRSGWDRWQERQYNRGGF